MTAARLLEELQTRASGRCELCGSADGLRAYSVSPGDESSERSVLACADCAAGLGAEELDPKRWFCLKESVWSAVPAVQVVSYRLLHRLRTESWASEVLEQAYLADDVLAWANQGLASEEEGSEPAPRTVDCHGNELANGDSVTLARDLDVKGAGFVAKQGTRVDNIRLTDDPRHVEGRVNKIMIVLKTEFLKKA